MDDDPDDRTFSDGLLRSRDGAGLVEGTCLDGTLIFLSRSFVLSISSFLRSGGVAFAGPGSRGLFGTGAVCFLNLSAGTGTEIIHSAVGTQMSVTRTCWHSPCYVITTSVAVKEHDTEIAKSNLEFFKWKAPNRQPC